MYTRTFIALSLALILFSCGTNRSMYQSPDFEQKASKHKTVAILPVRMVQSGYLPKNVSMQEIKASNEQLGYVFQESLQSYVLKQTAKRKKGQPVVFQGLHKTNALLNENGWSIEDLYNKQPEELSRILGVDAVLMTTLHHNKNLSDGLAYGVAAAKIAVNIFTRGSMTPDVNASEVNLNSALYDAQDSKLLWKTYRAGESNLPSDVHELIRFYSNWIAKKLPYKS